MLYVDKQKIIGIYAMKKTILRVWYGADLVWDIVRSCFGAGWWAPKRPWLYDDRWRYLKQHNR